jgi:hypothetical protein
LSPLLVALGSPDSLIIITIVQHNIAVILHDKSGRVIAYAGSRVCVPGGMSSAGVIAGSNPLVIIVQSVW